MEKYNQYMIDFIKPKSTVLDLGCGNGDLLAELKKRKQVTGTGVEISPEMISLCISKGISVFQGDIDEGLKDYGDKTYDYVLLSQTLQVVHNPVLLLTEIVRVGKQAILTLPNFGFILNRLQLMFAGKMPVHKDLPHQWYDTPNIHLCSRNDFRSLCSKLNIRIIQEICLGAGWGQTRVLSNLFAAELMYVISMT